ncbi:MAG: hypothetical protein HYZ68_02610 [Chloroflexi bacterium]|nr:hypothetical protein [Chloroflexota bacterium]
MLGLEAVRPRGGAHVHYALKIPQGAYDLALHLLESQGVPYVTHPFGRDDVAIYFFDHDLHGIELRESTLCTLPEGESDSIPVRAFQEVVIEFEDLPTAHRRLTEVYGFRYAWGSTTGERAFTAYRFAEEISPDHLNPHTELFCWDPQIGIADAQPGEHVYLTVTYPAHGFEALRQRVGEAGLTVAEHGGSLFVRDPERHVFEFQPIEIS